MSKNTKMLVTFAKFPFHFRILLCIIFHYNSFTYGANVVVKFQPLITAHKVYSWDALVLNTGNAHQAARVRSRGKIPSISNIETVIEPFVQQKCFVHIENFYYVNFGQLSCPVYLRKPELAFFKIWWYHPNSRFKRIVLAWILNTESPGNTSVDWDLMTMSNDDILFYNIFPPPNDPHYLLATLRPINFFHHSVHSKPWSCQVNIFIFPPPEYPLPPLMWYPSASELLASPLPSEVPKIAFFLIDKPLRDKDLMQLIVDASKSDVTRVIQISLAGKVSEIGNPSGIPHLMQPTSVIKEIQVLLVCPLCKVYDWRGGAWTAQVLSRKHISLKELQSLSILECLAFPDSNALIPWVSEAPHPSDSVLAHLLACQNYESFSLAAGNSSVSHAGRYAQSRAHILQSIMGNYSMQQDDHYHCFSGQIMVRINGAYHRVSIIATAKLRREVLVNVEGAHATLPYLITVENKLDALQFVSCGQRSFRPFPFKELISVFDNKIWLLLIIMYMAALPNMFWLHKKVTRFGKWIQLDYTLAGWKILLEQGEDILENSRNSGFKIMSASFILMGVVLNNAYKNTNVYNMIAQRAPIGYERMDELIQDKFTIFCKLTKIDVNMQHYRPVDMDLIAFRHEIHDPNKILVTGSSEILELKSSNPQRSNFTTIDVLYKHTTIHSGIKSLVNKGIDFLASEHHNGKKIIRKYNLIN